MAAVSHWVPTSVGMLIVFLCLVGAVWVAKIQTSEHNLGRREGHLVIHRATWGPIDNPAFTKDVTNRIRAATCGNSIDMPVSIVPLGDPKKGATKQLTVFYSFVEKEVVMEVLPISSALHLKLPKTESKKPI